MAAFLYYAFSLAILSVSSVFSAKKSINEPFREVVVAIDSAGTNDAIGTHVGQVGDFTITLRQVPDVVLEVRHRSEREKAVWQSIPNVPFISAARGTDDFTASHGSFDIIDHDEDFCFGQTISSFVTKPDGSLLLSGTLHCPSAVDDNSCIGCRGIRPSRRRRRITVSLPWSLRFSIPNHSSNGKRLQFNTTISSDTQGQFHNKEDKFTKVFMLWSTEPSESIHGLGEQFTHWNLKGKRYPIMVKEDGIGRGAQPTTSIIKLVAKYVTGDTVSTYNPVPHYITSKSRSVMLENLEYSMFDLTKLDRVSVKVASTSMVGRIFYGSTPLELIESFTEYSGRMRPLPDWILSGAIIGVQGGSERVHSILNSLMKPGTPIAGIFIQDWCGSRRQRIGFDYLKRVWWNWEYDPRLYPDFPNFVKHLQSLNISVVGYVNSMLAADLDTSVKSVHSVLFDIAKKRNYLVLDKSGTKPLLLENGPGLVHGIVDLFNPEAYQWLKDVIKKNMLDHGVKGFMADFGEYLPILNSRLTSGLIPDTKEHNAYAMKWQQLTTELTDELGNDAIAFHRSGFTKSAGVARLLWTGDQSVSWDQFDGLRAAFIGTLQAGLSGISMLHSDIGGYTTSSLAFPTSHGRLIRRKKLLLRWAELGMFMPVFRSHEGGIPDMNYQVYTDNDTIAHMSYCAKFFRATANYKKELMNESAEKGYPLWRPMYLHYPSDEVAWRLNSQFMFGPDVLVAPVLHKKAKHVRVYLPPKTTWRHLWTNSTYRFNYGTWLTIAAPIGQPGVFLREPIRKSVEHLVQFARTERDGAEGVMSEDDVLTLE